ncbi:SDR family NAD(P)-dependent oxidoreductase [Pseudomaricurvus sp.]|uniref:SDR family NAD(P)-dependent oxidoreductase n=1 Tax=Pseudomaricurvus sp. TaxID=2004510 RepID=UPI003F6D5BCF
MTDNNPRVAVITGASSGIGKETAILLASQGWRVIGVGRNPERTAAAQKDIESAAQGTSIDMYTADLSLMSEVAKVANGILESTTRIDLLINNAGGMNADFKLTSEGNEVTFASNHLAPFLLTLRLLPRLQQTAAEVSPGHCRILSVSSSAHLSSEGFDWTDVQLLKHFDPAAAYCQAKLANLLFNRELTNKVAADGIVVHAMHPGVVDSNFASHTAPEVQAYLRTQESFTPVQAAEALVWVATSDEAGKSSNGYYYQRQPEDPSTAAQNDEFAKKIWEVSTALIKDYLPA